MLDLRIPTGAFFLLVGIILSGMGLFEPGARASLTDANVNLYCGAAMIGFGAILLALAWRGRPS